MKNQINSDFAFFADFQLHPLKKADSMSVLFKEWSSIGNIRYGADFFFSIIHTLCSSLWIILNFLNLNFK